MYEITHSLLSSWLYCMSDSPYSDSTTEKDSLEDFLKVLRREPTETTEAMQKGIDFEDLVTDITLGKVCEDHKWFTPASKIAEIVGGGTLQYSAKAVRKINGLDIFLYGRLDCLKAGSIYDIKFSGSYDRGKFQSSTQHPMYFELVPEANSFSYLVSNGAEVWTETYNREDTQSILPVCSDFISWLSAMDFLDIFKEKWKI